jgi:hypothetical protein
MRCRCYFWCYAEVDMFDREAVFTETKLVSIIRADCVCIYFRLAVIHECKGERVQ